MATYTSTGGGGVVVCNHYDTPYEPIGGSTHSIRAFDGNTNEQLGFLDYDVSGGSLCIHTLSAGGGRGIGTILMFEAAVYAPFHGKHRLSAIAVAREAYGFYLKTGLHPDADPPVTDMDFEAQLMIGRMMRGTWSSSIDVVKSVCYEAVRASWVMS
jgi:hypothetical protein